MRRDDGRRRDAGRCFRDGFADVLLGQRNQGVPGVPAAEAEGGAPENELDDEIDGVALLPADLAAGVGGAAARAGEGRGVDLMIAGAAWNQ